MAKNIKERFGDSVIVGEISGGKVELRRRGTEETGGRDIPLISIYVNEDGACRVDGTVGGRIVLKPDSESPYSFEIVDAVDNPVIPVGPEQERLIEEAVSGAVKFKDTYVQARVRWEETQKKEESEDEPEEA